MQLFIDSADINKIKNLNDYYKTDGVTTNPTILANEKGNYVETLKEIRSVLEDDQILFVQTLLTDSEGIINEGKKIVELLDDNTVIKVPATKAGYKAIKALHQSGIYTLATAIFTAQQALMAAKCGADYVAPYVNRIDNTAGDSAAVVSEIVNMYQLYNFKTKVLGASFKNINQVNQCSIAGAHSITVSPDIIESMHTHPSTEISVKQFGADWENQFGTKGF